MPWVDIFIFESKVILILIIMIALRGLMMMIGFLVIGLGLILRISILRTLMFERLLILTILWDSLVINITLIVLSPLLILLLTILMILLPYSYRLLLVYLLIKGLICFLSYLSRSSLLLLLLLSILSI